MARIEVDMSRGKRPSLFWLFTETGRALIELSTFYPYRSANRWKEVGDGHPIMLMPGFMASEVSLVPLYDHLDSLGYEVYHWGLGRNTAKKSFINALVDRVDDLYMQHERTVTLIGQSLGGIYARQVAKARPKSIRQVISLGSPIDGITKPNHARWMYDVLFKGRSSHSVDSELVRDIPKPAPVPSTSIYTKEDGIVHWKVCLEQEDEIHQNVQVRGSHLGMAVNPSVLRIIEDRLQYDKKSWQKFEPQSKMEHLFLYPSK